jgi:hypothetical protein
MPSSASRSTGRASTALLPRVTIGLCISSGWSAITRTRRSSLKFRYIERDIDFPALVLLTHWDNFTAPFEASQQTQIDALQSFVHEVNAASPKTRPSRWRRRRSKRLG